MGCQCISRSRGDVVSFGTEGCRRAIAGDALFDATEVSSIQYSASLRNRLA